MVIGRLTPVIKFEVWNPRWNDRKALIADYKIGTHNQINFPKAKSLAGDWYISGKEAKTFPLEPLKTKAGGTMNVRVIPLDALQPLERGE